MLGGTGHTEMSETLVTIGKYFDATEAHIAGGLLQSEGIPVFPIDINHVSANPVLGIGLGGVRLQVPASFEQRARKVLANRESPDEAELVYLATGARSKLEESEADRLTFGVLRIGDQLRRKEFWVKFVVFDLAFSILVLLAIWATA